MNPVACTRQSYLEILDEDKTQFSACSWKELADSVTNFMKADSQDLPR